jgi:anti-anti-sigma factor
MSVTVQWSESSDVGRCTLSGELDLATEGRVRQALLQLLSSRPRRLVIDMGAVSFIDSTGLRALLSARNRASTTGTRIVLANVGQAVTRTLQIANLTNFFEFEGAA